MDNLQEVINGEKDTRMQWQERFEKESSDNNIKTGMLNQTKAELRDQLLAAKNAEIM